MAQHGIPVPVEVYHPPNTPPAAPDLTTAGFLHEIYERGRSIAVTGLETPSHLLTVALGVDIRDGAMEIDQVGDHVYIPDATNGMEFEVFAVVRRENQRVCYLRRKARPSGVFTPL